MALEPEWTSVRKNRTLSFMGRTASNFPPNPPSFPVGRSVRAHRRAAFHFRTFKKHRSGDLCA